MRRHPNFGTGATVGFLGKVAGPFVVFALRDFLRRPFLELGVAVGLSFVGWLFVRKR